MSITTSIPCDACGGQFDASQRVEGVASWDATRVVLCPTCGAAPELADALNLAESALAIKSSLRDGEQAKCQTALDAARAALRKAGRLS